MLRRLTALLLVLATVASAGYAGNVLLDRGSTSANGMMQSRGGSGGGLTPTSHVPIRTPLAPNFSVDPTAGTVGSAVAGEGTGFPVNSTVAFSFAGAGVASTCSTDSSGSFPGMSGETCGFVVPPAPAGDESVAALGFGISNNIFLGNYSAPWDAAYDPNKGEVYVLDSGVSYVGVLGTEYVSANVSVISDTNDSVVATVAVPFDPYAITFGAGTGELFVSDFGVNDVSVINDTNNTVVSTIGVGDSPSGAVYDPGTGQLFVADFDGNNVTVISVANDTVVATIAVGLNPYALAYDPITGYVFVTNSGSYNVSIIDGTTDSVVDNVPVGGIPYGVTYDPRTGEIFVSNILSGNLSVISGTTDAVVGSVAVAPYPYFIAYDPRIAELFVTGFSNMSVVSDSTDSMIATLPTGNGTRGLAFDSGTGEMFVTNTYSGNVSTISISQATAQFGVNSSILLNTSSGSADVGQLVTVQGGGFGSSLPITRTTLGSFPLACAGASTGTCEGGLLTSAANGSFVAQFAIPSVPTSGLYNLSLTDSADNTATISVPIYLDPTTGVLTAAPSSIDLGQATTFAVSATLGSGNYQYAWSGLPAGCSGVFASVLCTPSAIGTSSVSVAVNDSNGFAVLSQTLNFTVYADPTVSVPVASPGSGGVDAGQRVMFSTTAEFGTGFDQSYTWSGLPVGCAGATGTITCSGAGLAAGTYSINVTVTDSSGYTSEPSPDLSFFVYPDPTLTSVVATASSVDLGQVVTFSATAGSGAGGYTFAWSGLPTGCAASSSGSASCTPTASGPFTVRLQVTDLNGAIVTSTPLPFTVFADPSVTLEANRTAFDLGQAVTLTAAGALGSGGVSYAWSGLPTGCIGTGVTFDCVPSDSGIFSVVVTATDSNGMTAVSAALTLHVAASLSATEFASTSTTTVGTIVEFTGTGNGGTGPLSFTWEFGDGSTGTGGTVNHTFGTSGTFAVSLWVNDSSGGSVKKTLSVSISASGNSSGISSTEIAELAGIAALLAIVAAVSMLVLRRRKRREPSAEVLSPSTSSALLNEEPQEVEHAPDAE